MVDGDRLMVVDGAVAAPDCIPLRQFVLGPVGELLLLSNVHVSHHHNVVDESILFVAVDHRPPHACTG